MAVIDATEARIKHMECPDESTHLENSTNIIMVQKMLEAVGSNGVRLNNDLNKYMTVQSNDDGNEDTIVLSYIHDPSVDKISISPNNDLCALKEGPLASATLVARPAHENQLKGDGQALPPMNALYKSAPTSR